MANTISERSKRAIAMYATIDREGYAFMCLDTGRSKHSNNWTVKPVTLAIVQRVEHIAKDAENIEDILENDNDVVDDEEFENLKRKVIRRSEIQQNNQENENERNNNEVDVQENDLDRVVTDEDLKI